MFSNNTWFCILVFAMQFNNFVSKVIQNLHTHAVRKRVLPKLLWVGDTGFGDRFGDPEKKKRQIIN